MGHDNRILILGVSDWSVFPNTAEGITHDYALRSPKLQTRGTESIRLECDGRGNARLQIFSEASESGSVLYDSKMLPLAAATNSTLGSFSADRIFIANDQAGRDNVRRIWLRIDDIKVESPNKKGLTINFDTPAPIPQKTDATSSRPLSESP